MMARILIAALALLACSGALAEERIRDYNIEVRVGRDGALEVTENITVRAEGSNIRRGIYRTFPTRYKDRFGNRVVVDLKVLAVLRNDEPEPWFTEELNNGVRINTGNDNFLPVPADYKFTLRYRTTRQLGFFDRHDELYWNAIGTDWAFPIDRGRVDVFLPSPVDVDRMTAEGYTGYQGSKEHAYRAEIVEPGHARWDLTRALQPSEGFTIVLSFPKGLIAAPSAAQRFVSLLKDNRGILIGLIGLILLIVYCVREWSRVGRDPRKGVIIARYEPPEGQTPASLRFLMDMGYDMRCFSSGVLALAVAGCLRIVRDKGFFKDEWRLESTGTPLPAGSAASQGALLEGLFKDGEPTLVLKNTNATKLSAARTAHSKAIENVLQPRYYKTNTGSIGKALVLAAAFGLLAFWLGGEAGKPAVVVIGVLMVVTLIIFGRLVRAPTLEGRKLMDEVEGLKLYLSVAERDELARMSEPGTARPALDEKRYEMLLPYAVALEVEDAWTEKFTAAVGVAAAAEATRRIGWYHGGGVSDLGSLSRAVGSSLTSQIASSATPPGSSSGSGGGGSSGGGGGGGGGGGR
ncbi:MAG TPA: DUF2207 domain-containing protein [Steroidobacteraceae bacterium]|nr:DUF2207 domain-containing protein [Steroidobacteraceae bacterium]